LNNPVFNILAGLLKKSKTLNVQNPNTGRIYTKQTEELSRSPEDVILLHLEGVRRIGISPWIDNERVIFGAVDLDLGELPEEERQKHALEVYQKLVSLGFKPFIERSKGKGYHVWLFFSQPVKADVVAFALDLARNACTYPNKRKIELFPPKKTPLFLPLFSSIKGDGGLDSEFVKTKRNAFLKPENLNQLFSNWFNYYERFAVKNVKTLNLLEKLKDLPPCFLKAYENWRQGNRNGYTAGLAAVCKNVLKLTEEEAEELILSISRAKGDDELPQRAAVVYSTYEKEKPAGCKVLKGKSLDITVETPVCEKDCEVVEKLKKTRAKNERANVDEDSWKPEPYAKELIERFSFWYEGTKRDFWYFDEVEGIWKNTAEDWLKHFLYESEFLPKRHKRQRYVNELVEFAKNLSFKDSSLPDPPPELIPFRNGVYDLERDTFRPYRKDDYFTFRLPWNYVEGAECPQIDKILHDLVPEDRVVDLYELIAYCLWRGYPYQKFFILYGKGRNGKSAFTRILTTLLGDNSCSSVPLEELLGGGFQLSELYRKLVNIAGELSYSDIKESSYLKMLTGEDPVTAPRKFKSPITFRNYAKMIFLTNQVPLTHDTSDAFYRRVFLIEFPYKFLSKKELELHLAEGHPKETLRLRNPKLLQQVLKSRSEFEGLAYKSIQILKELRDRGFTFTNDQPVEELRALYDRVSNPLLQFIEEFCVRDPDGMIVKSEFRLKFWEWLKTKGLPQWSDTRIGKTMKEVLGFTESRRTIPSTGKLDRVWLGLRWKDYPSYFSSSSTKKENKEVKKSFQGFQGFQGSSERLIKTTTGETIRKRVETLERVESDSSPVITCNTDEELSEIDPDLLADFCGYPQGYIFDDEQAKEAIETLKGSRLLYLDLETYSDQPPKNSKDVPALDPFRNKVRLISAGNGVNFYTFDVDKLSDEVVRELLSLLPKKLVIGHNLKFDLKTLAYHYGREYLPERSYDTYLAEKLIWNAQNPEKAPKGTFSLQSLAKKYLNKTLDKTEQASDFGGELTESQIEYALNDVRILPEIVKAQIKLLNSLAGRKAKEPNEIGLTNLVARLEGKFLPFLVEVELSGIPVNEEFLKLEIDKALKEYQNLYIELKQELGINPQSSQKVLSLLKNRYGLNVQSTSKDELLKHKDHPVVAKILKLREAKKLSDAKQYLETVNGRLYPEFNQIEAHSGRMSAKNPNVQQIPRKLKSNFYKAPQGRAIIKADYPAIELRLAAAIAPDRVMIEAFKEGKDLHKLTASLVSGKPIEQVTKEERQRAKALNFGFIYGMSAKTFKDYAFTNYGVVLTDKEAEEFREKFFNAYPGIAKWHRITADKLNLSDTGVIQVSTLLGRKVAVNRLTNALNVPVQGSGADLLKMACVFFKDFCKEKGIDAQVINLVHDEIVVETSLEDKEAAKELLKQAMEKAANSLITQFTTTVEVEEVDSADAEQGSLTQA